MANPEILAPAGANEQLLAAVRCGADAVYLGTTGFNARRNAANFDENTLPEAVAYCHARGVKLYVTVNTVVTDGEMEQLCDTARLVASSGADAVIIQDMAVLRLFAGRYPSLRRIASTQTAVHNVDGAKFLQDAGFDGVVLARELTLAEMEKICHSVTVGTEAFLHGAHCMSVSGMCYLSAMLGGRSGNRGLCAQPCRLDWRCGGHTYALSLKDMSLLPHIREMADAGVGAFKIEGRMKRPEYVAAAVTACRQALAGEPYDAETLRAVFSRGGFTDGYLTGRRNADMFGSRTKEDVESAAPVLKKLAALYQAEAQRVPTDMRLTVVEDGAALSVTDGAHTVTADGPAPETAHSRPLTEEAALRSLQKTGGTPFYVRAFSARIAPGVTLPAAALNAMRRDALARLEAERGRIVPHAAQPFAFPAIARYTAAGGRGALWARFASPAQIVRAEAFTRILLPAHCITPALIDRYGAKLLAELPAVLFPADEGAFLKDMQALAQAGLSGAYTENVYGIALGKRLGLPVYGGHGLNVLNSHALAFYESAGLCGLTLSFELSMGKLSALGGTLPRGVLAYGYLPLMRFRCCPVQAGVGCAACGEKGALTDRLGVTFPVECSQKRYSTLLNSVPLHIAGREEPPVDWKLLYFTRETPAKCERVTEDFLLGRKTDAPHTGGLYWRELL